MTTEKAFEKAGVTYFGGNFQDWFFPVEFDPEKKTKHLFSQKLPREVNDYEVRNEFHPTEVSLEEIANTLKTADHSWWMLFYAKDKWDVLRAVYVAWSGDGWSANANAVDGSRWIGGLRVFSRNSFDSKTPDPDTLTLESRVTELEKTVAKLTKIINIA